MNNPKRSNSTGLKEPFKIETIHAFIATDDDGVEGLAAFNMGGNWFPMVAADDSRLRSLRPVADAIAQASGKPLTLARFSTRTDLEVLSV